MVLLLVVWVFLGFSVLVLLLALLGLKLLGHLRSQLFSQNPVLLFPLSLRFPQMARLLRLPGFLLPPRPHSLHSSHSSHSVHSPHLSHPPHPPLHPTHYNQPHLHLQQPHQTPPHPLSNRRG
ncbi:hypothetical protein BZA77DRAFT_100324 [Pyronema omphalodes]|nr:hypothetical protein BZA77DRAFT_100324 [Pyronema omphalodes]